jgi:hypothetical protein
MRTVRNVNLVLRHRKDELTRAFAKPLVVGPGNDLLADDGIGIRPTAELARRPGSR